MTKKKVLKLPDKIFVRWNEEDMDDPFLDVRLEITEHAFLHDSVTVGVYELRREKILSNKTTVTFD